MFPDKVNQIVRKIFSDKLLLGLLIVCLLGIFVGGFNYQQETAKEAAMQALPAGQGAGKVDNFNQNEHLQPELAVQFVKWWLRMAMDYTPSSAAQSHQAAKNWMTEDMAKCFNEAFWSPALAQQVASGAAVGAFQPVSVQAQAINPDNSVVVSLTGTLVLQVGGQPKSHQIDIDVLVRKDGGGLRVAGLYNRLTSLSASIY